MKPARLRSLGLVATCCLAMTATAEVPPFMNYQGRLLDDTGYPVNSVVAMTFTIYSDATGTVTLWDESWPTVEVHDGLFEVRLGAIDPIPDTVFDGGVRYLGLSVDGGPISDPLIAIVAVGYSFRALQADQAVMAQSVAENSIATQHIQDGSVLLEDISVGEAAEGQVIKLLGGVWVPADDEDGQASGGGWTDDGTTVRLSNGSDSVGIGYSAPGFPLHVLGKAISGVETVASGLYAAVGGGHQNQAIGDRSGVSGGYHNHAEGSESTVGGGQWNLAFGAQSTVAGGEANAAQGWRSAVVGGYSDSANGDASFVGGGNNNTATGTNSTVSGGLANVGGGDYAVVAGGHENGAAGDRSAVGGGYGNDAVGGSSAVAGGRLNLAEGDQSFVGGGESNRAAGWRSVVAGGDADSAIGDRSFAGGGENNVALGEWSFVGGGGRNRAEGQFSVVGGGDDNMAVDIETTVGGGANNEARSRYSTIGGGTDNITDGPSGTAACATVAGGSQNQALHAFATVAGGGYNKATAFLTAVGGGSSNHATDSGATVCGGAHNFAGGRFSVIAGGGGWSVLDSNAVIGNRGVVGGGRNNVVNGAYSVIPGGESNVVGSLATYSLAFGQNVHVNSLRRVAFYDGPTPGYLGVNRDEDNGGINFPIHVGTNSINGNGAHLTPGGTWTNGSSRSFKENFRALDGAEVLGRIDRMPIESWEYRGTGERHIWPCAEDFHAAFDVGTVEPDGTRNFKYLAAGDVAGVALAGVQELNRRLNRQAEEIVLLRQEIALLQATLDAIASTEVKPSGLLAGDKIKR